MKANVTFRARAKTVEPESPRASTPTSVRPAVKLVAPASTPVRTPIGHPAFTTPTPAQQDPP